MLMQEIKNNSTFNVEAILKFSRAGIQKKYGQKYIK